MLFGIYYLLPRRSVRTIRTITVVTYSKIVVVILRSNVCAVYTLNYRKNIKYRGTRHKSDVN